VAKQFNRSWQRRVCARTCPKGGDTKVSPTGGPGVKARAFSGKLYFRLTSRRGDCALSLKWSDGGVVLPGHSFPRNFTPRN
jgi:hypothetical protein